MEIKKFSLGKSAKQSFVLLVILIALCIFFSTQNPKFAEIYNVMSMVRQSLPNLLLACTMMFVIASGAIDLSIGGVMALCAVLYGKLCVMGMNPWVAVLTVIALGVVIGVANSIIMDKLKIPSIMATLATWIITAGMAMVVVQAIPISDPEMKAVTVMNSTKFFNNQIPLALFIVIGVIALFVFLERRTLIGKYSIAIGGNESAAYYAGVNVFRMRTVFFMLSGVVAAFSGVWQVGRLGSADPAIGIGMEFSVIAAVILGGVNIKGGEGTIVGVVLGTLILMVLTNGMQMMGIHSFSQQVVIGVVLYAAVLVNSVLNSRSYDRKQKTMEKKLYLKTEGSV